MRNQTFHQTQKTNLRDEVSRTKTKPKRLKRESKNTPIAGPKRQRIKTKKRDPPQQYVQRNMLEVELIKDENKSNKWHLTKKESDKSYWIITKSLTRTKRYSEML